MTHTAETSEPTLTIGAANDVYEQQADAVANQIMRMPEQPFVQRKCAHCEEEVQVQRKPLTSFIQRKADAGGGMASQTVANQIQATKGGGSPLPVTTRSFMERRFGADFSGVNIHDGDYAAHLSSELNAQAFTVGNDIYFNSGKYEPDSTDGKQLLAHELTHTVQQNAKVETNTVQRKESIKRGDFVAQTNDKYYVIGSPTASGTFPPASQTANLDPDNDGYVALICWSEANEDDWIFDNHGFASFIAKVWYEVTENGRLNFINTQIDTSSNGGFEMTSPTITVTANVTRDGTGGVITVTHLFGNSTTLTAGMTAGIGVPPISAGASVSSPSTSQNSFVKQYNLNLNVNEIQPIAYAPDIFFRTDSDIIAEGEETRLTTWFLYLDESLKRQIREGRRQLLISGFASTSGTVDHNRDLSLRRARRIRTILSSLAGERADVNPRGMGEVPARSTSADSVEDPAFRRARIIIMPPARP